jgi:hypothetical protein
MKRLFLPLFVCFSLTTFAQKTDFSGTYKVNKTKTDFGEAPEFILPRFIKVNQEAKQAIIARTQLNAELQEQKPTIDTLSFDGKPSMSKTASGNSTTTTAKWLNDKSFELTINITKADGSNLLKAVETWNLEENGKLLFINRAVDQGSMQYTTKAYFDKQ